MLPSLNYETHKSESKNKWEGIKWKQGSRDLCQLAQWPGMACLKQSRDCTGTPSCCPSLGTQNPRGRGKVALAFQCSSPVLWVLKEPKEGRGLPIWPIRLVLTPSIGERSGRGLWVWFHIALSWEANLKLLLKYGQENKHFLALPQHK